MKNTGLMKIRNLMPSLIVIAAALLLFAACGTPTDSTNPGSPAAPQPQGGITHLDTLEDGSSGHYGRVSALSPSFAAVSDASDSAPANGSGVVHLYDRSTTPWTHIDTVEPVSEPGWPSHTFFNFGAALALTDQYLVVGTPNFTEDSEIAVGTVQVFEYNGMTGSWDYAARLDAETPAAGDEFGSSLAVDGGTIIVGAPVADAGAEASAGKVFLFEEDGSGGWRRTRLYPETAQNQADNFGWSVAISGDRALVGVPGDDTYGVNSGSVAAYAYDSMAGAWSRTDQFVPSLATRNPKDNFGRAVDMDGTDAVIGASHLDSSTGGWTGKAYIYRHDGTEWIEDTYIVGWDDTDVDDEIQLDLSNHSRLGDQVAIDGSRIILSASYEDAVIDFTSYHNLGAVFVLDEDGGEFSVTTRLYAPVSPFDGAYFGYTVSLEGGAFLAGTSEPLGKIFLFE